MENECQNVTVVLITHLHRVKRVRYEQSIPYKASGHRDEPSSRAVRHWKKRSCSRQTMGKEPSATSRQRSKLIARIFYTSPCSTDGFSLTVLPIIGLTLHPVRQFDINLLYHSYQWMLDTSNQTIFHMPTSCDCIFNSVTTLTGVSLNLYIVQQPEYYTLCFNM